MAPLVQGTSARMGGLKGQREERWDPRLPAHLFSQHTGGEARKTAWHFCYHYCHHARIFIKEQRHCETWDDMEWWKNKCSMKGWRKWTNREWEVSAEWKSLSCDAVSHIEAKYRGYSSFESNPWALNKKSCQNVCHFKPVLITFFCGKQKMISFPLTSNIWTKKYNGSQWQLKWFGYEHFSNDLLCTAE